VNVAAVAACVYLVGALVLPFDSEGTLAGSLGPLFLVPALLALVAEVFALQLKRGGLELGPRAARLTTVGLSGLALAIVCVAQVSADGPLPRPGFGAYVLVVSGLAMAVEAAWSTWRLSRS
jgi:peptidoglycan/LPS O-acetylase OafA/YrhL